MKEGGFQPRPRYNNNGGYDRQGGYNRGGYNRGGYGQQGGFSRGGYTNQQGGNFRVYHVPLIMTRMQNTATRSV